MSGARPLLVLGVGNVFYGDEGAGVHLVHYLRTKHRFPEGVDIGYGKRSSHEWEVPDLLTAMELHGDLPEVSIVAICVDPLEFAGEGIGVRLGPVVGPRLPALATVVLRELEAAGVVPADARPELTADTPFTAEAIVVGANPKHDHAAGYARA